MSIKLISIVVATVLILLPSVLRNEPVIEQQETVVETVAEETVTASTPEKDVQPKPEPTKEKTEEELRSELIAANPKGCDQDKQWITWPDGECNNKTTTQSSSTTKASPAAPSVAQTSGTGSCDLVYDYDWPQSIAYQICQFESGGNPNAANWSDDHSSWAGCFGSFGLMQINCSHGQVYDGIRNMQIAYSMYKGWGNSFAAWTTCAKVAGCS